MFSNEVNNLDNKRKFLWFYQITTALSKNITNYYKNFFLSLHHSINDIRGFDWWNYNTSKKKFIIQPRYTAILNIKKFRNFNHYLESIRKDRRQDYNKAKNKGYSVSFINDLNIFKEFYEMTFKKNKQIIKKKELEIVRSIAENVLKKKEGKILCVKNEKKEISALQLFFYDKKTVHAVAQPNHPKFIKDGVSTYIFLELFKICQEEGCEFIDFNGANSPKLSDMKHSLLGEEKLFFNIIW